MRSVSRWLRAVLFVGFAVVLAQGAPPPAHAFEGMLTHYLKGGADFFSGYLPGQGLYTKTKYAYYYGEADEHVIPSNVDVDVDLNLSVLINSALYVSDTEILGGTYAVSASASYSWVITDAEIRRLPGGGVINDVHSYVQGFADPSFTPVILGWVDGRFGYVTSFTVFVPSGRYEKGRPSIGKNFWSIMPQAAVTYLREDGWHASASAQYLIPFRNQDVNYKSGNVLELDWTLGKSFEGGLNVGVAGYALQQTTNDAGNTNLGAFRARVFGIGPAIAHDFHIAGTKVTAKAKYYREFAARDTFQGDLFNISLFVDF